MGICTAETSPPIVELVTEKVVIDILRNIEVLCRQESPKCRSLPALTAAAAAAAAAGGSRRIIHVADQG